MRNYVDLRIGIGKESGSEREKEWKKNPSGWNLVEKKLENSL